MMRLAMDISQMYSWPAASGIQRMIFGLVDTWPSHILPMDCVFELDRTYRAVSTEVVSGALEERFRSSADDSQAEEEFRRRLWDASSEAFELWEIPMKYTSWLLPEPNYRDCSLDMLQDLPRSIIVAGILSDISPETAANQRPASPGHSSFSRYFREVAKVDMLFTISERTYEDAIHRLRRDKDRFTRVIQLGANHLAPSDESFGKWQNHERLVVSYIGTLIERKRPQLLLDAFLQGRSTRERCSLRFVGRSDPSFDATFADKIHAARKSGFDVSWFDSPTDRDILDVIQASACVAMLGEEGFGFVALEALGLGCPVIASKEIPSVREFGGMGVKILDSLEPDELVQIFEWDNLAPLTARLRIELEGCLLPEWDQCSFDLAVEILLAHDLTGTRESQSRREVSGDENSAFAVHEISQFVSAHSLAEIDVRNAMTVDCVVEIEVWPLTWVEPKQANADQCRASSFSRTPLLMHRGLLASNQTLRLGSILLLEDNPDPTLFKLSQCLLKIRTRRLSDAFNFYRPLSNFRN
jgi:glycosyltransferase involved in cell wall biosynthesis